MTFTIDDGTCTVTSHVRWPVAATATGVTPSVLIILIVTIDVPELSSLLPVRPGSYM